MSAILSADDLNDFISPGVACIKPVETLPKQRPDNENTNAYEVTTEDKVAAISGPTNGAPAEISLTDCLACSGCVTSAEAVLVSLQSHQEVLNTLNAHISLGINGEPQSKDGKLFVASISPQTRASLAAVYNVSEAEAGHMIEHLLAGPQGLRSGGTYGSGFTWVLDTNTVREISQQACVEEVASVLASNESSQARDHTINGNAHDRQSLPKKPVLASACPGWICYAEKTHPHILPHLSRVKSPQAIAGTLLKSVLSKRFNLPPDRIWHLAVMPCFDKKLEASREELTDGYWSSSASEEDSARVRDVDCVITARELIMLADDRGIAFPSLPRTALSFDSRLPFPDRQLDPFLFPQYQPRPRKTNQPTIAGPSGGYAYAVLLAHQRDNPNSTITVERGRNVDVVEYVLRSAEGKVILKTARYYGFRNIQNLVRKLKPAKQSRMPGAKSRAAPAGGAGAGMVDYAYVEVMACPGGCTNGGGQVKAEDVASIVGMEEVEIDEGKKKSGPTPAEQKAWLATVDEAYYSASSLSSSEDEDESSFGNGNGDPMDVDAGDIIANGHGNTFGQAHCSNHTENNHRRYITNIINHWSLCTGIELNRLLFTSYRKVESDVGKNVNNASSDMERVAGLAHSVGGGW